LRCGTSRSVRARSPRRSAECSRRAPRRRGWAPASSSRPTFPSSSAATGCGCAPRWRTSPTIASAPACGGRHELTFTVTDSGVGLTRAEIAKLFRPFAQANSAVGRRFGGAGLGLVFVKRLAEAMQGELAVESEAGRGSTFRLTVTLAHATEKPAAARRRVATTRSLRVLCAEDNPYARVVLNTILTELGHRTDFAGTGEAAVAAVERGAYDVVLMDLTLPGLDGLSAARAIRALPDGAASVRIIGVSGRTEPANVEAALAAGMNAFLAKPVSAAALAQALAHPSAP
jgi:CheY-like chemotaxis protein